MKNQIAVIDLQGFKGFNNKFIVKEVAVCLDMKTYRSFLIKAPYEFCLLSEKEQKMANWIKKHHHGIEWTSGNYSLEEVQEFLDYHLRDFNVYVKGLEKGKWVAEILKPSKKLIILSEKECNHNLQKLKQMYPTDIYCNNHESSPHTLSSIGCALINALAVRQFLEKENTLC